MNGNSNHFLTKSRDCLLFISSYLTVKEYLGLRQSCSGLYRLLPQTPTLKWNLYQESARKYLAKLKDPSTMIQLEYSQRIVSRIDSVFLYLIQQCHEREFSRFIRYKSYFNLVSKEALHQGFIYALQPKHYSRLSVTICFELCLLNKRIDTFPQDFIDEVFILVCNEGKIDRVSAILSLCNPSIRKTYKSSMAIRVACKAGKYNVVEYLLEHGFDASAQNNYCLYWASIQNYSDIVELLLKKGNVDPSSFSQNSLKLAVKYSNVQVIKILLADSRVDPSVDYNSCIRDACIKGNDKVVDLLLKHPKTDPSDRDNFAIRVACLSGYSRIVDRLLQDPRVDPSDLDWQSLKWAFEKGTPNHIECCRLISRSFPLPTDLALVLNKLEKKVLHPNEELDQVLMNC